MVAAISSDCVDLRLDSVEAVGIKKCLKLTIEKSVLNLIVLEWCEL